MAEKALPNKESPKKKSDGKLSSQANDAASNKNKVAKVTKDDSSNSETRSKNISKPKLVNKDKLAKKTKRGIAKKKKINRKKLKDMFQADIKDLIVGRRMASLNASAMMTASYAFEGERPPRRDPLQEAIEASLREAEERERKEKEEKEAKVPKVRGTKKSKVKKAKETVGKEKQKETQMKEKETNKVQAKEEPEVNKDGKESKIKTNTKKAPKKKDAKQNDENQTSPQSKNVKLKTKAIPLSTLKTTCDDMSEEKEKQTAGNFESDKTVATTPQKKPKSDKPQSFTELSESDIKAKLIESAKEKAGKFSKARAEDKARKRAKKIDEKKKSLTAEVIPEKRRQSFDLSEVSPPKKRKSSIGNKIVSEQRSKVQQSHKFDSLSGNTSATLSDPNDDENMETIITPGAAKSDLMKIGSPIEQAVNKVGTKIVEGSASLTQGKFSLTVSPYYSYLCLSKHNGKVKGLTSNENFQIPSPCLVCIILARRTVTTLLTHTRNVGRFIHF